MRQINSNYSDPLNIVWTELSKQLGFDIVRDPKVFAAFDGVRVLRIGTPETLDPDDSLGQMVLHELCHALVEGPEAMRTPDWGLDFDNPSHRAHEFATLRLQASFADHVAMRDFFASTTDFRWYFDLIPNDSLHSRVDPDSVSRVLGSSVSLVQESELSFVGLGIGLRRRPQRNRHGPKGAIDRTSGKMVGANHGCYKSNGIAGNRHS